MEDKKNGGAAEERGYFRIPPEAKSTILAGKGAVLHGIDIINSDYVIEYASRPMLQRHGELDGKTCYEVYMDRKSPCTNCPAIQAIRTMAPAKIDFKGKNGRHYVISASPVTNKDGSVSAVETIVDVTERVRREEERERSDESFGASEKKFRDLVEASSDWIWEVDPNGIYTYTSPKVRDLLGYEPDEVIGMTPFDLMIQSDVERLRAYLREIMAAKRSFERLENVNVHKDGQLVTLETSGVPILDSAGNLLGYRGIDRDISERKKSEEKLRQFSFIVEGAREAVIMTNTERKIVYVNRAAVDMLGYTAEEMLGRKAAAFFDGVPGNPPHLANYISGQAHLRPWEGEILERKKDGTVFPIRLRLDVVRNTEGSIVGYVGFSRDITENKRTEEALRESETKYKTLYESSRDAIMMLTPEEGFFSGNTATIKMFACKDEQEFTTQTPANLSPEHQPDGILSTVKAQQMMAVALEKGSHFFEWTHKRINGDEFYATVLLTKVELKGKSFLQATVRDITERKRVEEALRASEERMRAIINSVPGGVYTAMPDKNNTKTLVSANIIEMIGYTPDEMLKSPSLWESLILSEDRKKFETAIGNLLENKSPLEIEYRVVHKDGHIIYILDRATPILDENNNISMIEGIMVDISERKKLQEMIIQTDKLSAIGEMVAGIAHELNNPLGIISGHIQLLLARVKDRAVRSRLKKMEAHVQRGTKIIRDLLSFARKGDMETEAGDINATLVEALENVRSEIPAPNIRIVKELEPSLPQLTFDHQKMQIVFINIVKNAFQALLLGEGDGEVRVKSSLGDDSIIISVSDTGPGVETPLIRYIIDPFFTTKKVGKGTGLGLSIAYGIVKEHGGTIQAENVKGGGLLVTIELPVYPKGRD